MLSKVALYPKQDTGVGFYRILQPGRVLKRVKRAKDVRTIPFSGENSFQKFTFNDRTFMQVAKDADIIWSTIIFEDEELLKILNLRQWSGAKWIVDIDDNFYAVPSDNPSQAKAVELQSAIERCLALADGVTVSVPMLKNLYGPFNTNIQVQKNCLDFKIWDPLYKPKRNRKVRIGWRGAHGHKEDLALVFPALREIQKHYDVELVAFGVQPDELEWEFHDWVGIFDYPKLLASLKLDIALVPLVDSSYNRCKSNLNWLENAALKTPVIYSPTENQKGLPGIACSTNYEWYQALEKLVCSSSERSRLGTLAYEHVRKEYNIAHNVDGLATWFEELPRRELPA